MPKVYATYKDGSWIMKDKAGYYIVQWNPKTNKESKKHLKTLKNYVTKAEKITKKRTTRKNQK